MFAKTSFAAVAALAILGAAATTHASPAAEASSDPSAMSVSVSVADLNLSSAAGARIVLQRIHNAAKTICGDETDVRLTERFALYQSCVKTTVDRTVASLDSPIVTAMNGGHPGAIALADRSPQNNR
jgi:UrcA family protein